MFIALDLGGTKTRIALSRDLKSLELVEKFPSPSDIHTLENTLKVFLKKMLNGDSVDSVCVGIPGTYDYINKKILRVPNYKILENNNFNLFTNLFEPETTFYINNDASLAGLGESCHGAGKSYKNVAYITLSTGVGGALILNKHLSDVPRLYEPGHSIIKYDDTFSDNSGIIGSLESYLSGTGFFKRYGIKPAECNKPEIWEEYGTVLGSAVVNIATFWNPDVVVFGGSVSNRFDDFITPLNNYLNKITGISLPVVKKALLEDDAGLIGGLEYISQKLA